LSKKAYDLNTVHIDYVMPVPKSGDFMPLMANAMCSTNDRIECRI